MYRFEDKKVNLSNQCLSFKNHHNKVNDSQITNLVNRNFNNRIKNEVIEQSQALDFTVDDTRAVGLDKLDNILQTEKKEIENTVCRACYYKNKHFKKNKKNVKINA
ncbi:hypothetical protein [Spiroplasma ixodetis]|uniref:hypothetical protein n=1 Tax=Spiroplasma ixodetis TaxID=2141 RepID=UPI0025774D70|nr:hypothetical protein [Spiroplasma ixodetis]